MQLRFWTGWSEFLSTLFTAFARREMGVVERAADIAQERCDDA